MQFCAFKHRNYDCFTWRFKVAFVGILTIFHRVIMQTNVNSSFCSLPYHIFLKNSWLAVWIMQLNMIGWGQHSSTIGWTTDAILAPIALPSQSDCKKHHWFQNEHNKSFDLNRAHYEPRAWLPIPCTLILVWSELI